jgi:CHRD domain
MKHKHLRTSLFLLILLVLMAGIASARPAFADQGGRIFSTELTGAAEAPGPGDPDGSGFAVITLNQGLSLVCWELTATGIAPAAAAHIHRAPAGVPGPVVVPLSPPTEGSSSGCTSVSKELIKEIRQSPEEFYVNVHNADFPAGALRGQLGK